MVSIKVRPKPRPWAQRIMSSISSSFTSRSATVLILILRPARSAASMPLHHLSEIAAAGDGPEFGGIERVERDVDALHAASGKRLGVKGELAAVGGERELVEAAAEMPRQPLDQPHDVPPHQRLAAGQPQLAHALGDEGDRQPVELLERQQVVARQEGHGLRHAIDAAEVAAVGDRDAQIGDVPAEPVDHGLLRSCLLAFIVHRFSLALAVIGLGALNHALAVDAAWQARRPRRCGASLSFSPSSCGWPASLAWRGPCVEVTAMGFRL